MFTNPGFTLTDQVYWIVELALKTIAAEACKLRVGVVSVAVWKRVRNFQRRFLALHAQWKAGTLPKARAVREEDTSPRPTGSSPVAGLPQSGAGELEACGAGEAARVRPVSVLPRGVAWLHKMLPLSAGTLGSMLGPVIHELAEMRAFVAEVPQAGRMLRPICEMAGIKPTEWQALPKRVRKRKEPPRLSEEDEEKLRQITAWFPDSPAGREAKRIWRLGFQGKTVDVTKVSAVTLGLLLHPPRDGNCPPPEIGYGGSWPRLPKDYVRPKDWD